MKAAIVKNSVVISLTIICALDIAGRILSDYDGSDVVSTCVGGLLLFLRWKGSD